ncbi:MAG: MaoC family dehydratase N-terminal domain-containing protein [Vicinamibacterales bacterium]|jgi:hydroxyacyl-ACP dehydratase HTD2-like protein with hotdog domain|nr:MaoC family dehydratase N-terminal domain-containing protein [Vicinamibacterales bacterium]
MAETPGLLTPEIRQWVGRSDTPQRLEVTRRDIVKYAIATQQRLEKYLQGDEAPPMFLFNAHQLLVQIEALRPDGLTPDPLLPDLPLKRVMAGGIKNTYHRPIKPGDVLVLTRTLTDIYEKQGRTGPLIFVVYGVRVETEDGELVMEETRRRIFR